MTGSARLQAYMSGPLSGLPPDVKTSLEERYELIQDVCEDEHYGCYCPHQHSDPERDPEMTPGDVYRLDTTHLNVAELIVADCSIPALGVGIECQMANAHGTPVLIVAQQGAVVSRLLQGLPHVLKAAGDADIMRFTNDSELGYGLRTRLVDLKEKLMMNRRRREAEIVSFETLREYARASNVPYARYERLRSLLVAAVGGKIPRSVEDWEALDSQ